MGACRLTEVAGGARIRKTAQMDQSATGAMSRPRKRVDLLGAGAERLSSVGLGGGRLLDRLAIKIIIVLTLFSSVITLGLTGLQLTREYQRDVNLLDKRIIELKDGFAGSLTTSLWLKDELMVRRQMEGMYRLPDIAYVEVRTRSGNVVAFGEKPAQRVLAHRTQLRYVYEETPRNVGILTVLASLEGAHERLWDRLWGVLAGNFARTLLVSIFLFFLVQWLVTRHLQRIAWHLRGLSVEREPSELVLRRSPSSEDELSTVVRAVNAMQSMLWESFNGLRSRDAALRESIGRLERAKTDLEERGRVLEALAQDYAKQKEAAEAASRSKSAFLANMSHELRTPLNAIIGFSELIQSEAFGPVANERYRSYAEDIRSSGAHLLSIVNDMLDLARIEAGKTDLREEPIDLADLIEQSVGLATVGQNGSRRRIDISLEEDLPRFKGDRRALMQVLVNLLSNAVKFTRDDGRIGVAVWRDSGSVAIEVSDDGIGMPKSEISIVLQPFGQAESNQRRAHQGTGLGLPLSRSLVELHGGQFKIESEPGVGTVVSMVFPPERCEKPRDQAPPLENRG